MFQHLFHLYSLQPVNPQIDEIIQQRPVTTLPTFSYCGLNFKNTCSVGEMTFICNMCQAVKFQAESKAICCGNGKYSLDPYPNLPAPIKELFNGDSADSEHFLKNIRQYNCAFQMTSFGCKEVKMHGWNPSFKVQGQVYHLIGSLLPTESDNSKFLQIYFLDDSDQVQSRMAISNNSDLKQTLINMLQDTLHNHNKYIRELKTAYQYARQQSLHDYRITILENVRSQGEHERRYNAPSCKEVAILMLNEPVGHHDIVLCSKTNELRRICELHPAYDPLQYPLLFPTGNDGWNLDLKAKKKVSQLQFYRFHLCIRDRNYLLTARRLLQQFIVDVYAKIECERLQFLRREQSTLRADNYRDLRDTLFSTDGDPRNVGQKVILPATFTGGPRHMFERQQGAMTYVSNYGRPDLFIKMTTNPKWIKILIQQHLGQGEQAHDRPDLTVRVFKLKLKKLMDMLKNGAFGQLQAWLYSIEYQKRGLPHAHILLWLRKENKITPDLMDCVVSAEIPNKETEPDLHAVVTSHMIHGPCGGSNRSEACIKNGSCSKRFPKDFSKETTHGVDSYPNYRRRSPEVGGNTVTLDSLVNVTRIRKTFDNRCVVPHNPWLLRQLNCHVNVEICTSVRSIKYVLKYVHKGTDQATFQVNNDSTNDEIKNFVNARYVGSTEACWRIFEFPLHQRHPCVVQLAVHLENGQRVYFNEQNAVERATNEPPSTTLTQFFKLCDKDNFAKSLLYPDLPRFYTWNTSSKTWNRRKRGNKVEGEDVYEAEAIGRVYTVSPRQGECFYIRLLLHNVRGPTSFDALKTVNGIICVTFREACLFRGLLDDDNAWDLTLQEASISATPQAMRSLLAIIITQCHPSDVGLLWRHHKHHFTEDILHEAETTITQDEADNIALVHIENCVLGMGGQSLDSYGLPPTRRDDVERIGQDYRSEMNYNTSQQRQKFDINHTKLTDDQVHVFNTFIKAVQETATGIYFLDAPGGCGKTFLIETILAKIRSEGKIAIATASSGLAATLITGGRTVHSTFKVPLDLSKSDFPMCAVKKGTSLSRLIKDCSAIIIDEAPMLHKILYEALDRTLKDVCSSSELMGGIPVLLCGDFRQILPVVPSGTRADIVNACIKKSYLWQKVKVLRLTTNMRVHMHNDPDAASFSKLLLNVGDGKVKIVSDSDNISIHELGHVSSTLDELITRVFPDFTENFQDSDWLSQRAILAPLNDMVCRVNDKLISMMSAPAKIYCSVNSTITEEDAVHYPIEFLNSIEISGLPPHILAVKCGMPVMVLRAINPPKLMNGTRCVVTSTMANIIEVQISCGPYKHEKHLIPRIALQPSDTVLPFSFKRKQFPLRPCFALTVNKAQGQTLHVVGLDLTAPVFSHGMLYVALSRTGKKNAVHILAPGGCTRNVVYEEVLNDNFI